MKKTRIVVIAAVAIVLVLVLGYFAKQYNEDNHYRMALEHCGSKENIKKVDSKGFECVAPRPTQEQ